MEKYDKGVWLLVAHKSFCKIEFKNIQACMVEVDVCKKLKDYYTKVEFDAIVHPRCRNPEKGEKITLFEDSKLSTWKNLRGFWHGK